MCNILFKSKEVLTRKEHLCWGCAEKFPPKSRMVKQDGKYDNEVSTTYWCRMCFAYIKTLSDTEDGFVFAEFKYEDSYHKFKNSVKAKLIELT